MTAHEHKRQAATAASSRTEKAKSKKSAAGEASRRNPEHAASDKAQALPAEEILEKPREWQIAPSVVDLVDPLLSCLTTLAGLLQRPISAEALKAGLPQTEDTFTPELAVRAAARAGLEASITRRPKLHQILPITLPCILLLKGGNACVLLNYLSGSRAEIAIP